MTTPPPIAPPGEASLGGPVDNEMIVGGEDADVTWHMPPSTPAAPPPPEGADLGGFEDLAVPPPAASEPPPTQVEPPALAVAPEGADPLALAPPELGSTDDVSPVEKTPESIPPVDTQSTMDPVMAGPVAPPPLSASEPVMSEPSEPEPAPEAPPPSTSGAEAPASSAADDLVERVAQRVVDKLSSKVIEEIAWEVVPDLAEGLIQREIDVLKSKIPKSG